MHPRAGGVGSVSAIGVAPQPLARRFTIMCFLRHSTRGAALVDLIAACALMAVISAMAIPMFGSARDRGEARLAARYLATRFEMLRVQALRRNRAVAMRFEPAQPGQFAVYVDGDGDGVLQADVDRQIDVRLEGDSALSDYFRNATLAIRNDVPSPEDAVLLPAGSDPIRIGGTNFVSFSPLGTATSGSVYVVARDGPQWCVRLLGTTGRVRALWYDQANGAWRQD